MTTKTFKEASSLDSVGLALADVVQVSRSLENLRQNLSHHQRGSEAYLEILAEVAVSRSLEGEAYEPACGHRYRRG